MEKTYSLPKSKEFFLKYGSLLWVFAAGLCFAMPYLDDPSGCSLEGPSKKFIFGMSVGSFFLGLYVLYYWYTRSLLRSTVCTDAEGLWLKRVGRSDGLVRWSQIAGFKENYTLVLLDANGNDLIGLNQQLEDFQELRELATQSIEAPSGYSDQRLFRKKSFFTWFFVGIALFFVILFSLCLYFGQHLVSVLIAVGVIPGCIQACKAVLSICIHDDRLELISLIGKRQIAWSSISECDLKDISVNGVSAQTIELTYGPDNKTLVLTGFDIENRYLHELLMKQIVKAQR